MKFIRIYPIRLSPTYSLGRHPVLSPPSVDIVSAAGGNILSHRRVTSE